MFGSMLETSTTPPFLFRAASYLSQGIKLAERDTDQKRGIKDTISRGINTTEVIDPLDGYNVEYHEHLTELESKGTIKHMLKNHVNYENRVASEFSSWSVSLLYVLVHAIRKSYNEKNGILIYVMDTSKLPPSTIVKARDLLTKHGLQSIPNLMDYALGEYLIHGKLSNADGLWSAIPLESLIEAGLWCSFFELFDRKGTDLLKARVGQLRSIYFYTKPTEISHWHLRSLHAIAQTFGADWTGIVIMALVAFRRRDLSPDLMTDLAHELASLQVKLPKLPLFCAVHLAVRDILESCQLYTMLRLLNEREASLHVPCVDIGSDQVSESDSGESDAQDTDQDGF